MIIDLVRHGQIVGEAALYGATDVALSAVGWQQLTRSLDSLGHFDQLHTSPKKRCLAFVEDFSEKNNLNFNVIYAFAELNFGDWDGVPFSKLQTQWPLLETFWQAPHRTTPPNGESLHDFNQRVVSHWLKLTATVTDTHQVIVCHGGVIRMILAHLLDIELSNPHWYQVLKIDYGSVTRIKVTANYAQVQFIGATPNLVLPTKHGAKA